MTKSHHSIIAAILAILMVVGSIGTAVAGLQDCLPKSCCCMKVNQNAAPHAAQSGTTSGCTGNAPCCQVEPVHQAKDVAALTATPDLPESRALFLAILQPQGHTAHLAPSLARTFHHSGKPRAPLVPLYLATQTFLC